MRKKWKYCIVNNEKVENLIKEYNINNLLATILVNRGIDCKKAKTFLTFKKKEKKLFSIHLKCQIWKKQ